MERGIRWAQVLALAVFQAAENGAVLGGRGVLGLRGGRVRGLWRLSGRAWMVFVGCEFLRLGLEGMEGGLGVEGEKAEIVDGEVEVGGEKGEKGEMEVVVSGKEDEVAQERRKKWMRELGVNAACAPMTLHYSLKNGPLREGSLAALGMVVGWLTFGKAWRESA